MCTVGGEEEIVEVAVSDSEHIRDDAVSGTACDESPHCLRVRAALEVGNQGAPVGSPGEDAGKGGRRHKLHQAVVRAGANDAVRLETQVEPLCAPDRVEQLDELHHQHILSQVVARLEDDLQSKAAGALLDRCRQASER